MPSRSRRVERGEEEKIGYRSPPKACRWPKGTSGNPSGRKKLSNDFGEAFRRVAAKRVKKSEGGRPRRLTMIEAVMQAPMSHALMNDRKNRDYCLELMEEFGTEPEQLLPPFQNTMNVIYRDWEGKLVVNEPRIPRAFVSFVAECEQKHPKAAKAFLRMVGNAILKGVQNA